MAQEGEAGHSLTDLSSERYDVRRGGEFFNYLQLEFLVVEWEEEKKCLHVTPTLRAGELGRHFLILDQDFVRCRKREAAI